MENNPDILTRAKLEEELGRSLETNLLDEALCKAQAVMESAEKKTKGYNYKYAKLTDLIDTSRPVLCQFGLSIKHRYKKIDGEWVIRTILAHISGQWIASDYPIREIEDTKKSREQSIGTWITYFCRYQYRDLICMNVDDENDNDGQREAFTPYISDKQIVLLEHKMRENPDIAKQIGVKFNITNRHQILKKDFNSIIGQFPT